MGGLKVWCLGLLIALIVGHHEASRLFRRLLNMRRSLHYEQDIEQICA